MGITIRVSFQARHFNSFGEIWARIINNLVMETLNEERFLGSGG